MIYFDNAATTYPKPVSVISAVSRAMVNYGGNPGRSGHRLSMETAEQVFKSREKCAAFFGAETENTVFTLNCTHALNLAIKGILRPKAHIICSDIEHNAVFRPIHAASKENGVTYSLFRTDGTDDEILSRLERLINANTVAIAFTAASNVTGKILPYKKIAALCKRRGICCILDCAQGGGVLPVSLSDGINIICAAGHKGLYGPMGTGLMMTDGSFRLKTIIEGGTGSASSDAEQPEFLPDRFESGTINTAGAIALGYGIDFVKNKGITRIYSHEDGLCRLFISEVKSNKKVILYESENAEKQRNAAPIVPFNINGANSSDASMELSKMGIYLRGGYHCAYLAHKKIGTEEIGAIRFAPSVFNTKSDVYALVKAIDKITAQ